MSGAEESNDDLVSGRVNRSNDQTTIWAENHYDTTNIGPIETGSFRIEFNGPAIFANNRFELRIVKAAPRDDQRRDVEGIQVIEGIEGP